MKSLRFSSEERDLCTIVNVYATGRRPLLLNALKRPVYEPRLIVHLGASSA
jgi:hypothetical protein